MMNKPTKRPLTLVLSLAVATCGLIACGPDGGEDVPDAACKALLAGDLVITEFMADADGTDTGKEWFEIYNATGKEVDLKGLTLYASKVDGSREKAHVIGAAKVKSANYFVFGDTVESPLPAHVNYSYGDGLGALGNESGLLGLRCGTKKIDEVIYSTPAASSAARGLDGKLVPDSAANDNEINFCDATVEYGPGLFGSPGKPNEQCATVAPEGSCVDRFTGEPRPIVRPSAGELVISEYLADPQAPIDDTNGEWFEVFALAPVDLNELTLSNGGTRNYTITDGDCMRLEAGQYGVLARKSEPEINGGLPSVLTAVSLSLSNSGGAIIITDKDAIVIDRLTYASSKSGVSAQLDPRKLTALDNDDVANFCEATDPYGTGDNMGTPGSANKQCPGPVDPNNCDDNGAPRPIVPPGVGDLVVTEWMANPAAVSDTYGEFIEVFVKRDLDLNGVVIKNEGTGSFTLGSSDCMRVAAETHLVFVKSTDALANGGIENAYELGFSLTNDGPHSIIVQREETVIDQVNYTGSATGASTQVDASKYDATLNDDPASFCSSTAAYGAGDLGTPGALNGTCQ